MTFTKFNARPPAVLVGSVCTVPMVNRWPGVGMAIAAGLAQVRLVHRRARIAGGKNVVYPMATGAVGHGLLAGAGSQAMVAVLISGDARSRHVEARHQLGVGVAARAGDLRNIGQRNRRFGIAGRQDAMLAMAVRAGGGVQNSRGHRLPVNALPVGIKNVLVAGRAGGRHVLLPDFRVGSEAGRMSCTPWQSLQDAAFRLPCWMARPCTLCL